MKKLLFLLLQLLGSCNNISITFEKENLVYRDSLYYGCIGVPKLPQYIQSDIPVSYLEMNRNYILFAIDTCCDINFQINE